MKKKQCVSTLFDIGLRKNTGTRNRMRCCWNQLKTVSDFTLPNSQVMSGKVRETFLKRQWKGGGGKGAKSNDV